ncbi:MarR family winged helix-turn-helix transcriptional regulator [Pseudohalocynthiibacter sp. F2068]|jgi:DNA-binding MarR family transcriptional regulator|uniref:MarR family winged helix-turn-helix transcriptional regulator n=1 Tax=Pseudohalocynthiibacter sp. F2068 TaxID=2926418 RepID=UPI001FF2CD65|nr:MarR family winged helix-turn-helix transcriptional regulator [Pseudohalocynthiibacter sp. F2068]
MKLEKHSNCTCFNLRKATRVITQLYDEALKPSGIRSTQFTLLSTVQSKGPIGIAELAKLLATDRTTLTRNLKPLLDRDLLKTVSGSDARRRPVALTPKGAETLRQVVPLWEAVQAEVTHKFGQPRWENMIRDLNQIVSQIQEA